MPDAFAPKVGEADHGGDRVEYGRDTDEHEKQGLGAKSPIHAAPRLRRLSAVSSGRHVLKSR